MTLAHIPLHNIDSDDLTALIDNQVPETHRLEFKAAMYADDRYGKREFAKDVSAFANTYGGDLVIGIREGEDGIAEGIEPLVFTNQDNQILGWLNFLRDCIQPRIVGLGLQPVPVAGGHVVVIRVPKSYRPPHRANGGRDSRYYVRNPRGVHEASVEELRSIFMQGNVLSEKIRAFHEERTVLIADNEGVYPIEEDGGVIVLHVQPMSAYGDFSSLAPAAIIEQEEYFRVVGNDWTGSSPRINIDGAVIYAVGQTGSPGHTQVFRDGRVEYARNRIWGEVEGEHCVSANDVEIQVVTSLCRFLRGLQRLEVPPPFVVSVSLLDVEGATLARRRAGFGFDAGPNYALRKSSLNLPETVMTEYGEDLTYHRALKPMLDGLWNAFGQDGSPNFDADSGRWILGE